MKKTLIFSGLMLAAAFTLTNCVKETVNPAAETQEGVPFEIVAGIGTKTAVSPVAGEAAVVEWKADDAINLFVAETGGEYSTSNKFTIAEADLATGRFVGNLSSALDPQKTYEYKVVYPWTSGLKIDNTAEGGKYIAFGSRSNATQTQVRNNNADHLAGSNMPLYGVVKQVAGSATPQIEMHQAMAVVKVHVTNKSNAPLTVTSVAVTAPEGTLINGTFYMNFSGDEPTYTSSGATYTSNTAGLAVTSGAEIANNESADFYIGVLPFTLASGAKLGVSINGTEKEKAATAETVFAAGKIKTVNVDYEGSSVVYNTVAEVLKAGVGTYNMQNLLVYDANNANAIVGDDTGKMLLYKSNHGFVAGDNITIIGADVSNYNGVLEIKGGTMTKNSSGNPVSHGDPLDLDVEANAQSMPTTDGWYSAVYVKMKGQQDSGRNIQGTYLKLYLNANNNDTKNKNVVVTGYAYSYSTQYLNHSFHAVTIVENSNTLTVSPTSLNWAASETDAKDIAVTLNDGASGFTVSPETDNDWNIVIEDASVKVSPKAANTSTEAAKSITLTFTHKDEPTVQKTVTCSQAKASSGGTTTYTKVTSAPNDWSGTYLIVYEESGLVCLAGTDAYQNFTTAEISAGVISSNDLADYEVEIAAYPESEAYSIKALGGANANKYLEGKGNSNGTSFKETPTKETTFSISDGVVSITNNTNLFVYNSTSGSNGERWRFYKSTTAAGDAYKKPALYKKN